MPTDPAVSLSQAFRFTIDIETTIHPNTPDAVRTPEQESSQHALLQQLLAHAQVVKRLQRALAVETLGTAKELLATEYGWSRNPEQQQLQVIMEHLEPAQKAQFTEEIEDGVSFYFLGDEAYESVVKRFTFTELDPPAPGM